MVETKTVWLKVQLRSTQYMGEKHWVQELVESVLEDRVGRSALSAVKVYPAKSEGWGLEQEVAVEAEVETSGGGAIHQAAAYVSETLEEGLVAANERSDRDHLGWRLWWAAEEAEPADLQEGFAIEPPSLPVRPDGRGWVEREVWMRLQLHSSGFQPEARWAAGKVRQAMELAEEAGGQLLRHRVYEPKTLGDGRDQRVALRARVMVAEGFEAFDEAVGLVFDILDDGLETVNQTGAAGRDGQRVSYTGGAAEEEGFQAEFVARLKREFDIELAPAQPLTPEQVAFRQRAEARQRALQANLIELFGKPEEPSV